MKACCSLEDEFRKDIFNEFKMNQRDIAKIMGTYQASVCRMKSGAFLPRIEQLIAVSEHLNKEKYNIDNIKRNIKNIRIGNLTSLDDYSKKFVDYLFNLKAS